MMCIIKVHRRGRGMDRKDREEIEKIIHNRKITHEILLSKSPKVYKSFPDLEQKTFSDGSLKKCKELIAIGITIVINCESCLQLHMKKALRSGASEEQIVEAIEVGIVHVAEATQSYPLGSH
jgi:AhpD family alkylhydroperoxidase